MCGITNGDKYVNSDTKIHSMCFQSNKLFFSSENGISVVHLDTKVYCCINKHN